MYVLGVSSNIKNLKDASVEFVSELFYKLFKEMYDSIPKYDLIPETSAERWFREMLLHEYSRCAAEQSSLTEMVMKSLGEKRISSLPQRE
ncbi:rod-binding protein [Thermotoga sp.]|uniref:rod-binding protein n=1 Tax=Thermotoga sp. TaxID=28240 RepID=UPI0026010AC9|nr:rod-binding protein [Thermotoga sp.]MCD6551201.1 rod-binding protein [Thermotoga sp.]